MRARLISSAMIALLAGCSNAGADLGFPALPTGAIGVKVYLDRDGSQTYTTFDTSYAGVRVALFANGGTDTLKVIPTDSSGFAEFDSLPVGTYRVALDRSALGDSIGVVGGDTGSVRITFDEPVAPRLVRIGFPEVSIAQARRLPGGRRVFVRGVVLSPTQAFRDSSTFLKDTSGTLRVTSSRHVPGRTGENIGDSVLVLGTTGVSLGQAVLLGGIVGDVGIGAPPIPVVLTPGNAASANGGMLDAALASVSGARIVDTSASGVDFIVRIADSATSVNVLIDAVLQVPHGVWAIGLTFNVQGVLMPKGDGTWMIKPRGGQDVTLTN